METHEKYFCEKVIYLEETKKGIKNIAVSFFLMFLGPTLMFQSLNNEDHPWFLIVFITSILLCILAVYKGFRGLLNIMDAIFKKK